MRCMMDASWLGLHGTHHSEAQEQLGITDSTLATHVP